MNAYGDTSALMKRYVREAFSTETIAFFDAAEVVAVSLVARAEIGAAIARAIRTGDIGTTSGLTALGDFRAEWPALVRLGVTEDTVSLAEALAMEYGLRGFDALHLASALEWQDALGEPITLATFDRELTHACGPAGLTPWPPEGAY